jgi:serine/threonine-protein kinase SRPK3
MFFELLTGDFLFDPKKSQEWPTDEDQLALMIELMGEEKPLPLKWARRGKYFRDYLQKDGHPRNIHKLSYWALEDVLIEKYRMDPTESRRFADFLDGMLQW